ncbi:IS66 family transposase zinc-finger binding domain-containing protein [Micromonospora fulviviridis]|uniref:IS66 family transposase zinc-finger binding domain-containing protein n=1 Tax=Micromonospora fulviviridis TaxID=47860 RepID=A0ABV2VWR7_9ACTN
MIVRHEPVVCVGCGGGLAGAVEVGVACRQVFDIPEPKLVVTEHQIVTVACGCGRHTTGTAPVEATAPAAYGPRVAAIRVYLLHGQFLSVSRTADALKDLFGVPVTAGTVACDSAAEFGFRGRRVTGSGRCVTVRHVDVGCSTNGSSPP